MTTCLLSRMTRKPAFSKARTAWRCEMPGILPKLDGDLDLANEIGFLEQLLRHLQVLPDRVFDVRESLVFRLALRYTAGEPRYPDAVPLLGLAQCDLELHRSKDSPPGDSRLHRVLQRSCLRGSQVRTLLRVARRPSIPETRAAHRLRYHPPMPQSPITVATWNVNGIRAREAQFLEWVGRDRPDVICLQEIKASPDKISETVCNLSGYWCYWH